LFVHGSISDCRIWDTHRENIARRYRMIALTQRYFGLSPWPDDGRNFSIQIHANDLAAFITALRLDAVPIVGRSYGGKVALAMAAQHPKLVERLFLYEPSLATFVADPAAGGAVETVLVQRRGAVLPRAAGAVAIVKTISAPRPRRPVFVARNWGWCYR
jgi:pimeloyl-ACP methyl ester carboxylesterase